MRLSALSAPLLLAAIGSGCNTETKDLKPAARTELSLPGEEKPSQQASTQPLKWKDLVSTITGETVLEIEGSIKLLDKNVYEKLTTLKSSTSENEYKKTLLIIKDTINNLETLTPGASKHINNWIISQKNLQDINKLPLIERYIERLAIHGETDLDDALYSFTCIEVVPSENVIDGLLKLHRELGFLRPNRLVDLSKNTEERAKSLERIVKQLVRNFDLNYRKDSKILVVFVTGVTQDFEDNGKKDMFAVGGERLLQELSNYKVFVCEADNANEQIPEGAKRVKAVTGKTINFVIFAGHGESKPSRTNYGWAARPIYTIKPNQEYLTALKEKHADYVKQISSGSVWKTDNIATGNLTEEKAHLDLKDEKTLKLLKEYLDPNAVGIFASCSVGKEEGDSTSLARNTAKKLGIPITACTEPIRGLLPKHDEKGNLIGVIFLDESFQPHLPERTKVYLPK